jgi:hypothetical protein
MDRDDEQREMNERVAAFLDQMGKPHARATRECRQATAGPDLIDSEW